MYWKIIYGKFDNNQIYEFKLRKDVLIMQNVTAKIIEWCFLIWILLYNSLKYCMKYN